MGCSRRIEFRIACLISFERMCEMIENGLLFPFGLGIETCSVERGRLDFGNIGKLFPGH